MKIELKKSDLKTVDGGSVTVEAAVLSRALTDIIAVGTEFRLDVAKMQARLAGLPVNQEVLIPSKLAEVKYLEGKKVELIVVDPSALATYIIGRK